MVRVRNEVKAGVFVTAGVALLAAAILVMGKERRLFSDQVEYKTTFRDVKGLGEGAPVRLGGITVGRVDRVTFSEDPADTDVHVILHVDDRFADRIKSGTVATLQTQGLLGDRFVSVVPGPVDGGVLPAESTLGSQEPGDLGDIAAKSSQVVDAAESAARTLDDVLKRVNAEGVSKLVSASDAVTRLIGEVESGGGLAHQLLLEDTVGSDFAGLLAAARRTTEAAARGEGLFSALLSDPRGRDVVADVAKVAADLKAVSAKLERGDGLLGQLLADEKTSPAAAAVRDLASAASKLDAAASALTSGGGTLGALLLDSSLYDNLVEVTDGAKRSLLLRQAVRMSLEPR